MRGIRHWRPVNARGSWYLLICTVTAALCLPFGTVAIKGDNVLLPVLLGVVALSAAFVPEPPHRPLSFTVACLAALLLGVMAMGALWSTVLYHRGVEVTATVTWARNDNAKGRHLRYVLAGPDGQRIPGELGRWPGAVTGASDESEGRIGDRVTVVVDPERLVDPRLPEELADQEGSLDAVALCYALTAVLCMLAGRPPKARVWQSRWQGVQLFAD